AGAGPAAGRLAERATSWARRAERGGARALAASERRQAEL
ncbi:MAG: hypothetical protein AVDCRST_MAG40-2961, partial [uncultured Gemmatimonadaceae bacterium]